MRYRLRTLLIVLALGPMALAGAYWLGRPPLSLPLEWALVLGAIYSPCLIPIGFFGYAAYTRRFGLKALFLFVTAEAVSIAINQFIYSVLGDK